MGARWLVGDLCPVFRGSECTDRHLTPNELGDFLSGVFAPLAFLWLVVGVIYQRIDVRLQLDEMVQTTEASVRQAIATERAEETARRDAAERRRALLPRFSIELHPTKGQIQGQGTVTLHYLATNIGGSDAFDLSMVSSGCAIIKLPGSTAVSGGAPEEIALRIPLTDGEFEVEVFFRNGAARYQQRFLGYCGGGRDYRLHAKGDPQELG